MDKQAFKQRMQNLKSYRENNPGKGYWDWKVQAYQNGGENSNPWPNTSEQDRQYLYDKINPALGFGIFDFWEPRLPIVISPIELKHPMKTKIDGKLIQVYHMIKSTLLIQIFDSREMRSIQIDNIKD